MRQVALASEQAQARVSSLEAALEASQRVVCEHEAAMQLLRQQLVECKQLGREAVEEVRRRLQEARSRAQSAADTAASQQDKAAGLAAEVQQVHAALACTQQEVQHLRVQLHELEACAASADAQALEKGRALLGAVLGQPAADPPLPQEVQAGADGYMQLQQWAQDALQQQQLLLQRQLEAQVRSSVEQQHAEEVGEMRRQQGLAVGQLDELLEQLAPAQQLTQVGGQHRWTCRAARDVALLLEGEASKTAAAAAEAADCRRVRYGKVGCGVVGWGGLGCIGVGEAGPESQKGPGSEAG